MKKAAFHNLGCKVNSYEIEVMQQKMKEKGYEIVSFDDVADIYIVNTCTVTNIADRKSRQMLHRAKQLNPKAVVVAVGCYVQTGLKEIERDLNVDLCIGNNRKADLAEIVEQFLQSGDKTLGGTTVIEIGHADEYETMTLYQTAERTRAYIKIQDGCNQFCSYCAIPLARGRVRSRDREEIIEEIRGLVEKGYREIVLTGIHISSYGIDFYSEHPVYDGQDYLIGLLEELEGIEGLERIRLGSMEPRIITEDTARRLSALKKLCPHFHLSLQSGCDETLKRMNRHYSTREYSESVKLLRTYFSRPAVTTDVIVGFPGETEKEFEQSYQFISEMGFYETHVFKYSRRSGTIAAGMPGQITESVKAERSRRLILLNAENAAAFRNAYIGKKAEVLFEEQREINGRKYWVGHTRDYVRIAVEGERLQNCLEYVMVKGWLDDELLCGILLSNINASTS